MNINLYRTIQYIKLVIVVSLLVGLGAAVQFYQPVGEQSIFLITALIAISPVVIFEFWNGLKSPHVVLSNVEVVDFPYIVYDVESEESQTFNNGIVVRAYVKNTGFESATNCSCEFEEMNSSEKYPARWSIGGANPLYADLSPNEEQFVDTLWYFYNENQLAVPTNVENHLDFGGNYRKSKPAGLNELTEARFRLLIRASNMDQRPDNLSLNGKRSIELPSDLFRVKKYNQYTRSLVQRGNFAFAHAVSPHDWELHIPEDLDLEKLVNMPYLDEVLFKNGNLLPEAKRPVEIKRI